MDINDDRFVILVSMLVLRVIWYITVKVTINWLIIFINGIDRINRISSKNASLTFT